MAVVTRHLPRGFTLIELLVVLVVIGVALSTLQLNLFSDDAGRLRQEGERLAALLTALADEAVTGGRPLAVAFDDGGYVFFEPVARPDADTARWRPRPGDEMFAPRTWPPGIRVVEAYSGARPVTRAQPLVFAPSGLNAPFRVVLALADARVRVLGDAAGNLRVEDGADFMDAR